MLIERWHPKVDGDNMFFFFFFFFFFIEMGYTHVDTLLQRFTSVSSYAHKFTIFYWKIVYTLQLSLLFCWKIGHMLLFHLLFFWFYKCSIFWNNVFCESYIKLISLLICCLNMHYLCIWHSLYNMVCFEDKALIKHAGSTYPRTPLCLLYFNTFELECVLGLYDSSW